MADSHTCTRTFLACIPGVLPEEWGPQPAPVTEAIYAEGDRVLVEVPEGPFVLTPLEALQLANGLIEAAGLAFDSSEVVW
ncbi:hypothetical protein [Actinomyces culturomici]|uniref:hypothetical protein n=1 Tax=Actinomyces culturomici TaxID=1926276 RepID=UPI000E1FBE5E|nr:hypothetical protein [Actinomyces culturomici]